MAMLPESRKEQGLLLDQPVAANTTLPFLGARRRHRQGGWRGGATSASDVRALLADLAVKPA